MPIELENLNNLSQDRIDESTLLLTELVRDRYPEFDLHPGSVIYNLLIRPQALLHALNLTNIDRLRQSNSLLTATQNPNLADADIIDALLSNYRIERRDGNPASGQILLILNRLAPVQISTSLLFSAAGIRFRATRAFNGVTSPDNVFSSSDRVISPVGDGQYSLLIDVTAIDPGAAGNVSKGTELSPNGPILGLVSSVAAVDFDGGADEESNAELLERASTGVAVPNLGSRLTTRAAIAEAFPAVKDVAVVGAGQPEMRRDRHNAIGLSAGGKTDLYVRTRDTPQTISATKTATLVESSAIDGTWRFDFDRDELPAFYSIRQIRRVDGSTGSSLEIVQDLRRADLSPVPGLSLIPDATDNEAAFTRFQTAEVSFADPKAVNNSVGDKLDFEITLLRMPEIREVHDWLAQDDRRHPGGDLLVRAAVPCMVAVSLVVLRHPDDPEVDVASLQSEIAKTINKLRFGDGRLDSSRIVAAAQPILPSKSRLRLPVGLSGEVLLPSQGSAFIYAYPQSNYELVIPNRPDVGVTSNTVFYSCRSSDVVIDVQTLTA